MLLLIYPQTVKMRLRFIVRFLVLYFLELAKSLLHMNLSFLFARCRYLYILRFLLITNKRGESGWGMEMAWGSHYRGPRSSNSGVRDRDHAAQMAPEGMTDRQTDTRTHTHYPSII